MKLKERDIKLKGFIGECIGSKKPTKEQVEILYDKILEVFEQENILQTKSEMLFGNVKLMREITLAKLKDALKKILFQNCYENS